MKDYGLKGRETEYLDRIIDREICRDKHNDTIAHNLDKLAGLLYRQYEGVISAESHNSGRESKAAKEASQRRRCEV
ncbi:MAG: hypothetical protein GXP46_13060 [Deferribacteres bacterium]|nr:hypothetical protein [Deferribacteres bacterium]